MSQALTRMVTRGMARRDMYASLATSPYRVARTIAAPMLFNPYRQGAINAAAYVAKAGMRLAARKVQRWYRKRRAVRKGGNVMRLKKSLPRSIPNYNGEVLNTNLVNKLYWQNLCTIPQRGGTEPGDYNGDTLDITGVKVCHQVTNIDTTNPLVYHIAIVVPKYGNYTDSDAAVVEANLKSDFFTSNSSTDNGRTSMDFSDVSLSVWEKNCRPMSKMKWTIYGHHKFVVQPKVTAGGYPRYMRTGHSVYFERYYKIGKRFWINKQTSGGTGGELFRNPLYFLAWWEPLNQDDVPVGTEECNIRNNFIVYHVKR